MFAISFDEENYNHQLPNIEAAIREAAAECPGRAFWVGRCEEPASPEEFFEAAHWADEAMDQGDYCGDWCESWLQDFEAAIKEHGQELEAAIRPIIAAWVKKHGVNPSFFSIKKANKYTYDEDDNHPTLAGKDVLTLAAERGA